MKIRKKILERAIPTALLAFSLVAAIAYRHGVYDFTFIQRPAELSQTKEPVITQPSDDAVTPSDTESSSGDTSVSIERTAIEKFLAPLYSISVLKSSGYVITDTEWAPGYAFGQADMTLARADSFSLNTRTVNMPERVPYGKYSGYITDIKEITEDRPTLEVYMDYIIVDRGNSFDILRADGSLLAADFDLDTYKPAYTRDRDDRPLFVTEAPSKSNPKKTVTEYYYLEADGSLAGSDYDDAKDGRGLYINYPADFGKAADGDYNVYYDAARKLYTFANENGYPRTDAKYLRVFNFSENMACVVDREGFMSFVTKNFAERIFSGTMVSHSHYNSSNRRVYYQYLLPDTFGEESIGFFYLNNGLVRVRRQIIDAPHYDMHKWREINDDSDVLLRADGTEFPLPSDYTAKAYSNGMILLEKDGLYGFMDHTGRWVVQPVYTEAKPFNEGLAVIGKDGKMGMIDTNGEFVIPMIFDYIDTVSGGIVTAYEKAHGWVLLNKVVWTGVK